MGRAGRAERQVCDGASDPSAYQVRSVWPARAAALHQSRPTNRTKDTMVIPWPGSGQPGAAPATVFTYLAAGLRVVGAGVAEADVQGSQLDLQRNPAPAARGAGEHRSVVGQHRGGQPVRGYG